MSSFDLTTLANVKAWLGLPTTPTHSDTTLSSLVTAASRAIYAALSRPTLQPQTFAEAIDLESDRVFLRNWPVLQVNSVLLDGLSLPPATSQGPPYGLGYLLQPSDLAPPGRPQALDLFGRHYHRRRQTLTISYMAGYAIQGEGWTAPSTTPSTIKVLSPFGPWSADIGVVYSNSKTALQPVPGLPGLGQYAVSGGAYTFSAADAGAAISISYGFIPQDLVQAATELTAERFRAADRIGLRTKSIGGQETISYELSSPSAAIEALIAPYRRTSF